jgi:hypothetical protein
LSQILAVVQGLLKKGEHLVSRYGYRELAADDILLDKVLAGIDSAVVVEGYPDSRNEPSVLVLQHDRSGVPFHVRFT